MRREYGVSGVSMTISDYLRSKGYQTCEYIESHGTEYIDTGVFPDINTELTCEFQIVKYITNFHICGALVVIGDEMARFHLGEYDHKFHIGLGPYTSNWVNIKSYDTTSKHTGLLKGNGQYAFDSAGGTLSAIPNLAISIYAFARHSKYASGGATAELFSAARIYKLDITGQRRFIPIYNISTGAGASWDAVEDKFYFNQGTGTFGHGANKEYTEIINV